jgi:phosphoribosyl-ATP pyrophosphohydrolase
MSYHKTEIPKGVLGEISKITEEYMELMDAVEQDDKVLIICELTDLIGAIRLYTEKYNLTLEDLIKFSNKTSESFKEGKR